MIESNQNNPLSIRYKLARFMFFLLLPPFVKKVNGLDNLPRKEAFILAPNHTSHIDWLLLHLYISRALKRYIHFLATTKYYNNPLYKFLVEVSQCIMVKSEEIAKSMFLALRILKRGEIVGVFPEGTRSSDGTIKKGITGVAALALTARVPVVPAGLNNTHNILPKGALIPHFAKCEINIGGPIILDAYYKDYDEAVAQNDRDKILDIEEKVVRTIMKEIARLSNQEYPY